MTKKSLLIGVGSVAPATTPVFAIVSCSSDEGSSVKATYTVDAKALVMNHEKNNLVKILKITNIFQNIQLKLLVVNEVVMEKHMY